MKTRIHINKHKLYKNRRRMKSGNYDLEPVITAKNYKKNEYGKRVDILDENGNVVVSVVYNPEKPLSCGAVAWIETDLEVKVS